jgi:hypothetical protein
MSKIVKTKETLGLISTTLPIIGAIGTLCVWLISTYYVGDVELLTIGDKQLSRVTVKVYDPKGHEATYHTPKFQLMPGSYHLEITPEGQATQHADTEVSFNKRTEVKIALTEPQADNEKPADEQNVKKRWWQFWRH